MDHKYLTPSESAAVTDAEDLIQFALQDLSDPQSSVTLSRIVANLAGAAAILAGVLADREELPGADLPPNPSTLIV